MAHMGTGILVPWPSLGNRIMAVLCSLTAIIWRGDAWRSDGADFHSHGGSPIAGIGYFMENHFIDLEVS